MKLEAYSKEYFTDLRKHNGISLQKIGDACNCTRQSVCKYGNPLLYTLVLNILIHEKEGNDYDCSYIDEIVYYRKR